MIENEIIKEDDEIQPGDFMMKGGRFLIAFKDSMNPNEGYWQIIRSIADVSHMPMSKENLAEAMARDEERKVRRYFEDCLAIYLQKYKERIM